MEIFDSNFKTLSNWVILKRQEVEDTTEGGLYLPYNNDKSLLAEVVGAGPGEVIQGVFVKNEVEKGDVVLIDKIAGFEIEVGEDKFTVVRSSEIIGVVKKS